MACEYLGDTHINEGVYSWCLKHFSFLQAMTADSKLDWDYYISFMTIDAFCDMLSHFFCKKDRVSSQIVLSLVSTTNICIRNLQMPLRVQVWYAGRTRSTLVILYACPTHREHCCVFGLSRSLSYLKYWQSFYTEIFFISSRLPLKIVHFIVCTIHKAPRH